MREIIAYGTTKGVGIWLYLKKCSMTKTDTIHVKLAPGGGACVLLREAK